MLNKPGKDHQVYCFSIKQEADDELVIFHADPSEWAKGHG